MVYRLNEKNKAVVVRFITSFLIQFHERDYGNEVEVRDRIILLECVRNTWKDLGENYNTPVVVFMQCNESHGDFNSW